MVPSAPASSSMKDEPHEHVPSRCSPDAHNLECSSTPPKPLSDIYTYRIPLDAI
ncbi:hypothetical protein Hanom_Chr04g00353161 [Helianthus anomalus]